MSETIDGAAIILAMERAAKGIKAQGEFLTTLDQALGDGDMGITFTRIADAMQEYIKVAVKDDIGKLLGGAGLAANKAAPSTMGTLTATALMRAGKDAMGKPEITPAELAVMFKAAAAGMQERGKANLGDKTVLDAIFPACDAFAEQIEKGVGLKQASLAALNAARAGRDKVTPLRSKVGRASWVGERTEGKMDPGCAVFVILMESLAD